MDTDTTLTYYKGLYLLTPWQLYLLAPKVEPFTLLEGDESDWPYNSQQRPSFFVFLWWNWIKFVCNGFNLSKKKHHSSDTYEEVKSLQCLFFQPLQSFQKKWRSPDNKCCDKSATLMTIWNYFCQYIFKRSLDEWSRRIQALRLRFWGLLQFSLVTFEGFKWVPFLKFQLLAGAPRLLATCSWYIDLISASSFCWIDAKMQFKMLFSRTHSLTLNWVAFALYFQPISILLIQDSLRQIFCQLFHTTRFPWIQQITSGIGKIFSLEM